MRRPHPAARWIIIVGLSTLVSQARSFAQEYPDDPPPLRRVSASGEVSVTIGADDRHYFNFTDYDRNALRLFTASLGASLRLSRRIAAVAEVRLENDDQLRVSALYARIRPATGLPIAVQAGRIPPVFGAFARSAYGTGNPLVSMPLAYQYLTTLRSDAVPPSADALLAVRGEGWRVRYDQSYPSEVEEGYAHGLPLVSSTRWDTGVQVSARGRLVEGSAAWTVGSLSEPQVNDRNDGKQLVGRVAWLPSPAWRVGMSAARGAYLRRSAARGLPVTPLNAGPWVQRGLAVDAGYAAGHLQVQGEVIWSEWRVPVLAAPYIDSPLGAVGATVAVQYRLRPTLDLAARADRLWFSDVVGSQYAGGPTPWDANVSRVELGTTLRVARQVRLKLAYQHNWREGGRRESAGFPVAQLAAWF